MSTAKHTVSTTTAEVRRLYCDIEWFCKRPVNKDTESHMRWLLDCRDNAVARAARMTPRNAKEAAELAELALELADQGNGVPELNADETRLLMNACRYLVVTHAEVRT